MMKKIRTPFNIEEIASLKFGDEIALSGVIYTARDQAHKRLVKDIGRGRGKGLPFDIKNAVIYYSGPAKTPKGRIIGSCGPTTASRMDAFSPFLIKSGLKFMIGKGGRSKEVIGAIKKYRGVYFVTYAGCGALLSKFVRKAKVVAFKDLGPEAIFKLEVKDFPLIVAVDSYGRSIYGQD